MKSWAQCKDINNYDEVINNGNMLTYLNQVFIKDNADLYEFRPSGSGIPDVNVYRLQYTISSTDSDGRINTTSKSPTEMTAEDIRNIDVWQPHSVEISTKSTRYGNQIPIWQKSMNVRHHDRSDDGFTYSIKKSSLEGKQYGYGGAMDNLYKLATDKLKRAHSINAYR
jgi:hypothetical protein